MQEFIATTVPVSISFDDGSVAVMAFVTRGRAHTLPIGGRWENESAEIWLRDPSNGNLSAEIVKTFITRTPTKFRLMDAGEAAGLRDRTFRDAWTDNDMAIVHDMPKARAIHLDRLRGKRIVLLEQLDRDWMRAAGQGNAAEASRVEAERQALRDMPARVQADLEAAETVDQLKLVR